MKINRFNHPHFSKRNAAMLLAMTLASAPFAAHADEREDMEKLRSTLLGLIDTLVNNHVLPKDKADAMMREAEARASADLARMPPPETGADGKKIVRVPYLPESIKVQMHDQIKAEVLAETRAENPGMTGAAEAPSRFQFGGDFRLRSETARLDKGNTLAFDYFSANSYLTRAADIWGTTSNGIHTFNTQETTTRDRVRARLNMTAIVSDAVKVGVALSTGGTTGPTSTNQTMGQGSTQNPGYFNKYAAVIDRAYLKYDPLSWLSFSGGRMPNPFFATDLVWADDLNFEGFTLAMKPRLNLSSSAFITAGWFPLTTGIPKQVPGRSLTAVQGGLDWQLGQKENRIKLAAAYYDYQGIEGVKETHDFNLVNGLGPADYGVRSEYGAGYRQRGNTLFRLNSINDPNYPGYLGLASSFRELDLTGTVDLAMFDPVHVVMTGDLVKNLGFNRNEMSSRAGATISDGKSVGLLGRIQVGATKMARRGDWNVALAYRYLGSDAVLDAFTNSDFGLGGTNSKGTILGMNYGVDKNTWVSVRWMSSDLINTAAPSPQTSLFKTKFSTDVIQLDLNARF